MYNGFPVDVAEERDNCGCVDITGQRLLESNEPGHGCYLRNTDIRLDEPEPFVYNREELLSTQLSDWRDDNEKQFTEADLMRLAGQLERAEAQGYRFERYARCGVGEHRHRWEVTSKICQVLQWLNFT